MAKKKWIIHRAKSRRYRKQSWKQRHKVVHKNFGSASLNRSGNDEKIIRQFFTKRFRRLPEADPLYFEEWRKRLTTYGPNFLKGTMDKQGRDILEKLRKEKGLKHPLTNFEYELSI